MCEDVRIAISAEIAWVSCVEVIRPFGSTRTDAAARMQATNLFACEEGEWKMIHHHASASPDDEENEDSTVN